MGAATMAFGARGKEVSLCIRGFHAHKSAPNSGEPVTYRIVAAHGENVEPPVSTATCRKQITTDAVTAMIAVDHGCYGNARGR
jgi:hypothetical protein